MKHEKRLTLQFLRQCNQYQTPFYHALQRAQHQPGSRTGCFFNEQGAALPYLLMQSPTCQQVALLKLSPGFYPYREALLPQARGINQPLENAPASWHFWTKPYFQALLDEVFLPSGMTYLELALPAGETALINTLLELGFKGVHPKPFLGEDHQRWCLLSLRKTDLLHTGWLVLPIPIGLFLAFASPMGLEKTFFALPGTALTDVDAIDAVQLAGWLKPGTLEVNPLYNYTKAYKKACALPPVDGLPSVLADTAEQVCQYFCHRRQVFHLPLNLDQGTPFQRGVWQLLQTVLFGQTLTYSMLAYLYRDSLPRYERRQSPSARALTRAVASACSANPFSLIVPCHRVLGQDGRLVGYREGIEIKRYLLDHELWGKQK